MVQNANVGAVGSKIVSIDRESGVAESDGLVENATSYIDGADR